MKRLLLMSVLSLSLMLIGCGSSDSSEVEETTEEVTEVTEEVTQDMEDGTSEAVTDESVAEEIAVTGEEDSIEVNGQVLEVGMNVTEDVIAAVGDPIDVMEAPSCHYDGNDTIYTYEDFALYTYLDDESMYLYLIELTGDGVATANGVTVGMSSADVASLCGDDYENMGVIMEYTYDDVYVDYISDESGLISMIEIFD